MTANYRAFRKFAEKQANNSQVKTEDWTKGLATVGGAATGGALLTKYLPASGQFAKTNPVLRGALYAGGLSAGGLASRAAVDIARKNSASDKIAALQPPSTLAQDFGAGLDPFGVYITDFGQRAQAANVSEGEHTKKRTAATVGGVVGGGLVIPSAITGTIGAVKGGAGAKGFAGRLIAAGKGFAEGAMGPYKQLYRGYVAKKGLSNISEGKAVSESTAQAIKDTLGKTSINDIVGKGNSKLPVTGATAPEVVKDMEFSPDVLAAARKRAETFVAGTRGITDSNQQIPFDVRAAARELTPQVQRSINANLSGIGMGAAVGGAGAYVQYGKGREAEKEFQQRLSEARRNTQPIDSAFKEASGDMPAFLSQNRPKKVKEIYRALKREHPEYSAGKKARIANAMGKEAEVEYHGKKFPGYNQPIDSDRPEKKKMVLAKKGDQVKLIHFGQKGYKHNYSDEAKKNYLTRSAGIRGKDGSLTANDKFSANYWARRELWPKNEPADGSARNREKRASDDDIGHGMELAGLGILAAPAAAHLAAKVPGLRRAAGPVSELLHKNHSIEHAVELGGLGVLAAPSLKHYMDKRKQAKKE